MWKPKNINRVGKNFYKLDIMSWDDNNDDYEGNEVETWFMYEEDDYDGDNQIGEFAIIGTPEVDDYYNDFDGDRRRIVRVDTHFNYVFVE